MLPFSFGLGLGFGEEVKKRFFKFFLKRTIGQFLAKEIKLDELQVDLGNGEINLQNLDLAVDALNEQVADLPFVVTRGSIASIVIKIPWKNIREGSCSIILDQLKICIAPRTPEDYSKKKEASSAEQQAADAAAPDASLFDNPGESISFKGKPPLQSSSADDMEGLSMLSGFIESILAKIKVQFKRTEIVYEHKRANSVVSLSLQVSNLSYSDATPGMDTAPAAASSVSANVFSRLNGHHGGAGAGAGAGSDTSGGGSSTKPAFYSDTPSVKQICIKGLLIRMEETPLPSAPVVKRPPGKAAATIDLSRAFPPVSTAPATPASNLAMEDSQLFSSSFHHERDMQSSGMYSSSFYREESDGEDSSGTSIYQSALGPSTLLRHQEAPTPPEPPKKKARKLFSTVIAASNSSTEDCLITITQQSAVSQQYTDAEHPRTEIKCYVISLHILLTPKQFHLLFEILDSIQSTVDLYTAYQASVVKAQQQRSGGLSAPSPFSATGGAGDDELHGAARVRELDQKDMLLLATAYPGPTGGSSKSQSKRASGRTRVPSSRESSSSVSSKSRKSSRAERASDASLSTAVKKSASSSLSTASSRKRNLTSSIADLRASLAAGDEALYGSLLRDSTHFSDFVNSGPSAQGLEAGGGDMSASLLPGLSSRSSFHAYTAPTIENVREIASDGESSFASGDDDDEMVDAHSELDAKKQATGSDSSDNNVSADGGDENDDEDEDQSEQSEDDTTDTFHPRIRHPKTPFGPGGEPTHALPRDSSLSENSDSDSERGENGPGDEGDEGDGDEDDSGDDDDDSEEFHDLSFTESNADAAAKGKPAKGAPASAESTLVFTLHLPAGSCTLLYEDKDAEGDERHRYFDSITKRSDPGFAATAFVTWLKSDGLQLAFTGLWVNSAPSEAESSLTILVGSLFASEVLWSMPTPTTATESPVGGSASSGKLRAKRAEVLTFDAGLTSSGVGKTTVEEIVAAEEQDLSHVDSARHKSRSSKAHYCIQLSIKSTKTHGSPSSAAGLSLSALPAVTHHVKHSLQMHPFTLTLDLNMINRLGLYIEKLLVDILEVQVGGASPSALPAVRPAATTAATESAAGPTLTGAEVYRKLIGEMAEADADASAAATTSSFSFSAPFFKLILLFPVVDLRTLEDSSLVPKCPSLNPRDYPACFFRGDTHGEKMAFDFVRPRFATNELPAADPASSWTFDFEQLIGWLGQTNANAVFMWTPIMNVTAASAPVSPSSPMISNSNGQTVAAPLSAVGEGSSRPFILVKANPELAKQAAVAGPASTAGGSGGSQKKSRKKGGGGGGNGGNGSPPGPDLLLDSFPPSPFSSTFGSNEPHEENISSTDDERQAAFEDESLSHSIYAVHCNLPTVHVALDKSGLDVLYDRFNDLSMWAPGPAFSISSLLASHDDYRPAQESEEDEQSGAQGSSSDGDSDDDSPAPGRRSGSGSTTSSGGSSRGASSGESDSDSDDASGSRKANNDDDDDDDDDENRLLRDGPSSASTTRSGTARTKSRARDATHRHRRRHHHHHSSTRRSAARKSTGNGSGEPEAYAGFDMLHEDELNEAKANWKEGGSSPQAGSARDYLANAVSAISAIFAEPMRKSKGRRSRSASRAGSRRDSLSSSADPGASFGASQSATRQLPTFLSLDLHVGVAFASLEESKPLPASPASSAPPSNEPRPEARKCYMLSFSGLRVFQVVEHFGEPKMFFCLRSEDFGLAEGTVREHRETNPILLRAPTRSETKPPNANMLSVTVQIIANRSNPLVPRKAIVASVDFRNVEWKHTSSSDEHWIFHFIELVNFANKPVPGYTPFVSTTSMYINAWNTSLDYKPLYLPGRAVITIGFVRVASNIVAESPYTVFKFDFSDCALFIVNDEQGLTRELEILGQMDRFALRSDGSPKMFVNHFGFVNADTAASASERRVRFSSASTSQNAPQPAEVSAFNAPLASRGQLASLQQRQRAHQSALKFRQLARHVSPLLVMPYTEFLARMGFARVLDAPSVELTIQTDSSGNLPKFKLEIGSRRIVLSTCSDSFYCLVDLLQYYFDGLDLVDWSCVTEETFIPSWTPLQQQMLQQQHLQRKQQQMLELQAEQERRKAAAGKVAAVHSSPEVVSELSGEPGSQSVEPDTALHETDETSSAQSASGVGIPPEQQSSPIPISKSLPGMSVGKSGARIGVSGGSGSGSATPSLGELTAGARASVSPRNSPRAVFRADLDALSSALAEEAFGSPDLRVPLPGEQVPPPSMRASLQYGSDDAAYDGGGSAPYSSLTHFVEDNFPSNMGGVVIERIGSSVNLEDDEDEDEGEGSGGDDNGQLHEADSGDDERDGVSEDLRSITFSPPDATRSVADTPSTTSISFPAAAAPLSFAAKRSEFPKSFVPPSFSSSAVVSASSSRLLQDDEALVVVHDTIALVENHFELTASDFEENDLASSTLPKSESRFAVKEVTEFVWRLYGGHDFAAPRSKDAQGEPELGTRFRAEDELMEVALMNFSFAHDVFAPKDQTASRSMIVVKDFEIRDRLKISQTNKFLCYFRRRNHPRVNSSDMARVEILSVRPDPEFDDQELRIDIALLPLRVHVDKDSLLFLQSFFSFNTVHNTSKNESGAIGSYCVPRVPRTTPRRPAAAAAAAAEQKPKDSGAEQSKSRRRRHSQSGSKDSDASTASSAGAPSSKPDLDMDELDDESPPVFIQHCVVHGFRVCIDSQLKRVDFSALRQGEYLQLLGLLSLSGAQLYLNEVTVKGVAGFDRLIEDIVHSWIPYMKSTKILSVVAGVSPIRSVINVGSGLADLVLLPVQQYLKDGRVFYGLQKGIASFLSTTTVEMLDVASTLTATAQGGLELASDILTFKDAAPPALHEQQKLAFVGDKKSTALYLARNVYHSTRRCPEIPKNEAIASATLDEVAGRNAVACARCRAPKLAPRQPFQPSKFANQPENIREGLRAAYESLSHGVSDTVSTISSVSQHEQARGGGVVGYARTVLFAVPVAVLRPMIGVTEAASRTLQGARNTMDPAGRLESEEKFKSSL